MTPTEHTTAGTDLLLAVVVLGGIAWLRRATMPSGARRIWLRGLLLFATAALLGAVVHGRTWPANVRTLLWQPLYLLLGAALAFFVAGAVADWRGYPAARRALPFLLLLALAFYGATRLSGGKYIVFVVFQAAAILFTLWVYGRLAFLDHRQGAGLIFGGMLLSLVGGVLQAMKDIELTLVWRFDHNGLYHLVQMGGVLLIVAGLRHTLGAPPAEPA